MGKTIEAGLVIKEKKLRGELRRDWSIFRNFRLYHLGATDREVSVDAVDANTGVLHDVYTIQGVKVDADINSLQPGMYIIDGKAVYKK